MKKLDKMTVKDIMEYIGLSITESDLPLIIRDTNLVKKILQELEENREKANGIKRNRRKIQSKYFI